MYEPQAFFNRHAFAWDKTADHDPVKISAMLMLSDINAHGVILDVGCGTGVLEPYLLYHKPAAILAVDFAPNMILAAKEKVKHHAVKFVCADILDITDISADYCFIFNTFGHFPDPQKAITHITTLLRRGGRLTISHTQGKKIPSGTILPSGALGQPAIGLRKMLDQLYYVDVVVDNNAMLLISGLKK